MKFALTSKRLISLFVAGMFTASPVYAESLQEAVQYMIETNPDVRSSVYGLLARDEEVRQARAGYYPTFDAEAGAGLSHYNRDYQERALVDPNKSTPPGEEPEMYWKDKSSSDDYAPMEARLSLRQNVFAGMSTWNEVERQQARVRSGAYAVQATSENTALKTASAYLQVLRRQELVTLAKENLAIHQRITDKVELRTNSGVGSMADVDQIETRLNLAKSDVVVSELNLQESETNYLALVGRMPVDLVKPVVPASRMPVSMEDAEQFALANQPTLKSAVADLESRRKAKDVAESAYMPTIDLEAEQNWHDQTEQSDDKTDELKVMVQLRYNLFNGWKDEARNAEAAYLISEARSVRNHTHRQVVESIQLSWRSYKASMTRLPYLQQRAEYAKATAESYNKQWEIGKRTLLDVLNTEAERISADQEQLNTEYDILYAQYRVLSSTGQLVNGLGVEYPEESRIEESQPEKEADTVQSSQMTIHETVVQSSLQVSDLTIALK